MPSYEFDITIVSREIENETYLSEALFFPEVSRYGNNPSRIHTAIKRNAKQIAEECDLSMLYRRHTCAAPRVKKVVVEIKPPKRHPGWSKPIELTFHTVRWSHGEDAHIAFVPSLGIEVVGKSPRDLDVLVPAHIRFALQRTGGLSSLARLVEAQRCRSVKLDHLSFDSIVRSPKQIEAAKEKGKEEQQPSALEEAGIDLTLETLPEAYEIDDLVSRIVDVLVGRTPRSVLLVGLSGVGKTAAAHELVRRRQSFQLGRTPFWATSGSRLVAGMSGFGMWQERCQRLWREASKKRAILHLGNLLELWGKVGSWRNSMLVL